MALAAAKRPITQTDLYSFHWAADLRFSPDARRVIYTSVSVSAKHGNY